MIYILEIILSFVNYLFCDMITTLNEEIIIFVLNIYYDIYMVARITQSTQFNKIC
jgi:hypothetical protein